MSLNFSKMFSIKKHVKIMFKNREWSYYFLSSRGQKIKILQKLNKRDCSCLHPWFKRKGCFTQYIFDSTLSLVHFLNKIIY